MNVHYHPTVRLTVEFTPEEARVLEHARKHPLGVYTEKPYTDRTEFTLEEMVEIATNVAAATGNTEGTTNIFEPTGRENPEDVPGNGELADPAETLHTRLQTILRQWNKR